MATRTTARVGTALAALVAVVLGVLGSSPAATPDLLVVSLVALALAGVLALAASGAVPDPGLLVVTPSRRAVRVPPRRDRATDPQHHPVAPRAPGPA